MDKSLFQRYQNSTVMLIWSVVYVFYLEDRVRIGLCDENDDEGVQGLLIVHVVKH